MGDGRLVIRHLLKMGSMAGLAYPTVVYGDIYGGSVIGKCLLPYFYTNYQLPITNYQLPITNYQFPITDSPLPIPPLPIPHHRFLIPPLRKSSGKCILHQQFLI